MEADSTLKQAFVGFDRPQEYASKKLAVFALAGLSVVFLISALYTPSTADNFTICGFRAFTGLPCPGCGLTHSFCALGKGNLVSAFSYNLIGPLLFLVLVLIWVRAAGVLAGRTAPVRVFDQFAERVKMVRLFATSFVVYGVARIAYILVFDPLPFQESALSRLVTGLFR